MSPVDQAQEKAKQIQQEIVRQADAIAITDNVSYKSAGDVLLSIKRAKARIEETFKPMRTQTHRAWKTVCDTQSSIQKPLDDAEVRIKRQMSNYQRQLERARVDQQRAAQTMVTVESHQEAEENQLNAAIAAAESGNEELAEQILNQPTIVQPAPAVVLPPPPVVSGISIRKKYKAEVQDLMTLVKAVADGKVPLLAVQADQKWLTAHANSMQEFFNVPGVASVEDFGIAARAAREDA